MDRLGSDVASGDAARARLAIALIDLTDLADDRGAGGIDALCGRAAQHGTAAVCIWPEHVGRCVERLAGSAVRVATVVNFPSGEEAVDVVVAQTDRALAAGADEIDVVLPYRAFAAGDVDVAGALVAAVRARISSPRLLKVILETGALEPSAVAPAARLAIDFGADFVKTSTGKLAVGATLEAVGSMLGVVASSDRPIGIKPAGGIRTFADADAYLSLAERTMGAGWATPATFRFGASGLLDALLAVVEGTGDESGEPAGEPDRGAPGASTY